MTQVTLVTIDINILVNGLHSVVWWYNMVQQQVTLQPWNSRIPGSIVSSGCCLCGVSLHGLPMSAWDSSGFSCFLPSPKIMTEDRLMNSLWMRMWMCVHNIIQLHFSLPGQMVPVWVRQSLVADPKISWGFAVLAPGRVIYITQYWLHVKKKKRSAFFIWVCALEIMPQAQDLSNSVSIISSTTKEKVMNVKATPLLCTQFSLFLATVVFFPGRKDLWWTSVVSDNYILWRVMTAFKWHSVPGALWVVWWWMSD